MRSSLWLLLSILLLVGCRAGTKLATCETGVDSPAGATLPIVPAVEERAITSQDVPAGGVQLAAFQVEELPPMTLVNPAEPSAPSEGPEPLPPAASPASMATLEDVITSVYASYPALDAASRERQIAAGKQLAAMGSFDSNLIGEAISEPLGYYKNYRYDIGVKQYNWSGSQTYAGYRLVPGFIEPW